MTKVSWQCRKCAEYNSVEVMEGEAISCLSCGELWGKVESRKNVFECCPACRCRQFYVQKDFNQALGCFIMLIGIVLVPKTYGLSLPVFALLDWLIYRRIPDVVVCYRCSAEFLGFPDSGRFKPFMHHIGMKYDRK